MRSPAERLGFSLLVHTDASKASGSTAPRAVRRAFTGEAAQPPFLLYRLSVDDYAETRRMALVK